MTGKANRNATFKYICKQIYIYILYIYNLYNNYNSLSPSNTQTRVKQCSCCSTKGSILNNQFWLMIYNKIAYKLK